MEENRPHVVCGGACTRDELFIEPTVLDFAGDWEAFRGSTLMAEEVFGPLLPVVRYRALDEALACVRAMDKPLAVYVMTQSGEVVRRVREGTSSGALTINDVAMQLGTHELPFGGVGGSGMGRYHGKASFETFSCTRSVLRKSALVETLPVLSTLLDVRFPPYSAFKKRVVRLMFKAWVARVVRGVPKLLRGVALAAVVSGLWWLVVYLAGYRLVRLE